MTAHLDDFEFIGGRPTLRPSSDEPPPPEPEALQSESPVWEGLATGRPELTRLQPEIVIPRYLSDIPDTPPRPLGLGIYEPDGPTLLYAQPGTGKGATGAWIACEAQRAGRKPAIFDAERRPREWSRRVSGLGGDRSRILYIEPSDLPRSHRGRPLWDVAPAIGQILKAGGGDLLEVDSIMAAVGLGEDRLKSDPQVPFLYVAALDALSIPSISYGHPPKGQPEGDPFGSFAWLAAMRLTWLGTRAEGDGHVVRWRPRKRNERGHLPGILLRFEWSEDNRLVGVTREDDETSTRDWLLGALAGGPRDVGELVDELLEEDEEPPTIERRERTTERLKKALARMKKEGWVTKEGKTRNVRWSLAMVGS
jgi:hypothetical protein